MDEYRVKYIQKENPLNSMYFYKILDGVFLYYIDFHEVLEIDSVDSGLKTSYQISYMDNGIYTINYDEKSSLCISKNEVIIGKCNRADIKAKTFMNRAKGFKINILPEFLKLGKDGDVINSKDIIEKFLHKFQNLKNSGIGTNNQKILDCAKSLFYALNNSDLNLIRLKGFELIHLVQMVELTYNQTIYQKDNNLKMKIERAVVYIRDNYYKEIKIDRLCDSFKLSKNKFNEGFRKYYSKSPYEYLRMVRMNNSKRLLIDTDLSITEISLKVGYDNPSNFSRSFKDFTGTSPKEFRKDNKASN